MVRRHGSGKKGEKKEKIERLAAVNIPDGSRRRRKNDKANRLETALHVPTA